MKGKTITLLIFILCLSLTSINAFETDPTKVSVISIHDGKTLGRELVPGILVNVTVLVKNFSNDTMRNVNISQSLPEDLELVLSPFGSVNSEINITEPTDIEMPTGEILRINSGYANRSYFTFNFDSLINGSGIAFVYSINATRDKVFDIDSLQVDYLDHWGDPHTANGNRISLEFFPPEDKTDDDLYYPKFEVGEVDWFLIVGIGVGVVLGVSILSALVYFRKPFSVH
ncbi:MAG: hypothetical protein D6732_07785 [Methanobacteriota archaeon]|nr:MAG: hypothetical protein D6732_07785 [Euryarchaeota archaeon]